MKETFVLKSGWNTVFTNISDKQAGMLIKALYQFNCTDIAAGDIAATLADVEVKAYFNIMTLDCIKFREKYDRRCETSCENGRLGGRPKNTENEVDDNESEKPKKPNSKPKKPNILKKPDKDNDKDNEYTPLILPPDGGNDEDSLKAMFKSFREKFKGRKDGLETEYQRFKKHADWRKAAMQLLPALEKEFRWRTQATKYKDVFVPAWANLKTWLNQRRWEQEFNFNFKENDKDTTVYRISD